MNVRSSWRLSCFQCSLKMDPRFSLDHKHDLSRFIRKCLLILGDVSKTIWERHHKCEPQGSLAARFPCTSSCFFALYGFVAFWFYGVMVLWPYGFMVYDFIFIVAWFYGVVVLWLYGFVCFGFLGFKKIPETRFVFSGRY